MEIVTAGIPARTGKPRRRLLLTIWKYKWLYALLLPALAWVIVFDYLPLYGISIAFMDYNVIQGFGASKWVGFAHFRELFASEMFLNAFRNTLLISLYKMISGFICPILLALSLNEIRTKWFKKTLQTAVYLPRFVSWVVYGGIITLLLSPENGVINKIVEWFGGKPVYLLVEPAYFRIILVVTDAMKEMGWAAIIYLAAIAGLNPEVYEAAVMDGATRFKRIIHITLPGISSTIIVIFILRVGYLMSLRFGSSAQPVQPDGVRSWRHSRHIHLPGRHRAVQPQSRGGGRRHQGNHRLRHGADRQSDREAN